jgi:hypothetical protein
MSEPRQPLSYLIVGAQYTGKTKYVTELVQNSPKKVLVIVPDLLEKKYEGYRPITLAEVGKHKRAQIVFDPDNSMFYRSIYHGFLNGSLIFDDTKFCTRGHMLRDMENIVGRNRQTNTDVFLMYHSFERVPDQFYTYCKRLILFKTIEYSDDKKLRAMQEYVNNKVRAENNPYLKVIFDRNT